MFEFLIVRACNFNYHPFSLVYFLTLAAFAVASVRKAKHWASLICLASSKGVKPSPFTAASEAPSSTNIRQIDACPFLTAKHRGVLP